jgi:hypothetical protein
MRGKLSIGVILSVAVAAAAFSWWHQQQRGVRVLAYYGSRAAYRIRLAPEAELFRLVTPETGESPPVSDPTSRNLRAIEVEGGRYTLVRIANLHQAPGFVHARQALIEDKSFQWTSAPNFAGAWSHALRFCDADGDTWLWMNLSNDQVKLQGADQALQMTESVGNGFRKYFSTIRGTTVP